MRTLHVSDAGALDAAVAALGAGEVIVVPTDTVYGLAARPDDAGAVQKIYEAKERPDRLQLPVLAASVEQVRELGVEFNAVAALLADRWWPGPLTVAFGFSETAGRSARPAWLDDRSEVAVRIPNNDFLLALMRVTGVLLVTSANRHGAPTPPSAEEAGRLLAPHVELSIDAGTLDASPSTLVNVHHDPPVIEREGTLTSEVLSAVLDRTASA
jgi:L-threonylcarbamoyladenylate synthase